MFDLGQPASPPQRNVRGVHAATRPAGVLLALALLGAACRPPSLSPVAPAPAVEKPAAPEIGNPATLLRPGSDQRPAVTPLDPLPTAVVAEAPAAAPLGPAPAAAPADPLTALQLHPPPIGPPAPPAPTAAPTTPPTTAPAPPTATPGPAPIGPLRSHTVAPGDTARAIAERYGIGLGMLVAANNLANPNLLDVGQQLRVPGADGVLHPLLPGETVRQVAEAYGVPAGVVFETNGLDPNARVRAGTLLAVPGARAAARPPAPTDGGPRRVSDVPPPMVSARYIAILDEASGALLYGQNERLRVAPASVTKIATTLVALEREPDLGRRIPATISGSAMAVRDGSSIMGLEPNRDVSLRTLLFGMMLPSGNDAAEQVALALGGSRDAYVSWMNRKVADLGLQDTRFANPSGMDAAGHYSSAYDMALLGRAAMRHESFRELAAAPSYRAEGFSMTNLNRLIGAYRGADGLKIGYTGAAGRTIVASATRGGHRVYVSLMRSQDTPGDSTALFDWVWRTFEW